MSSLAALKKKRRFACRLTPDRALRTLDEAADFLAERGLLTLTPDCSLPSLFGACHEEPYKPGGKGFAAYPKTKWWWGGALTERLDVVWTKLHRGQGLFLSRETAVLADPLCRQELDSAAAGEHGAPAERLVSHLAEAGPAPLDDLKAELGLDAKELRSIRTRLERLGAIVARELRIETDGGHRHSSELYRWDEVFPDPPAEPGGLEELVVAGLRAALVVPEDEPRRWFSWPVSRDLLEDLVTQGRIVRPESGWLTAAETASARAPAAPARSRARA